MTEKEFKKITDGLMYAVKQTDMDYGGLCVVGGYIGEYKKMVKELQQENKRLLNGLRYYADYRTYDPQFKLDIMRDGGRLARKLVKELE